LIVVYVIVGWVLAALVFGVLAGSGMDRMGK